MPPRERTHSRPVRLTSRPVGALRTALVSVLSGALVVGSTAPALAVPPPPPNPSDTEIGAAQSAQDAAVEVGRIAALVSAAQAELERVTVQAEADAIDAAVARLGTFARDSYMNSSTLTTTAALLDSAGPGELIQRAALLSYVGDSQVDVLDQLEIARVQQANADSAARAARDAMAAAEAEAHAAKAASDAQVAAQQAAYTQITAQKAGYEQELQAARIRLLELQGPATPTSSGSSSRPPRRPPRPPEPRKRLLLPPPQPAPQPPAMGPAATLEGLGSGYRSRVVEPRQAHLRTGQQLLRSAVANDDVRVGHRRPHRHPDLRGHLRRGQARAGTATGFGLAVYILGEDGAVTVYGHINRYFVNTGERVVAGQRIAEVGNRGQSTGPHLHFEVHPNGAMYSGAVDPVSWLRACGISISGC